MQVNHSSIVPASAASYTYTTSTMANYYINATAGQTFTAYTQSTGGDPYLAVYNPGGTLVTANDDGYGGLDSYINNYTFLTTGTFRLNAGQCCSPDVAWSGSAYTIYITTTATVSTTSVDTTAPTVSTIAINANAGVDGTYIAGDVITATLTWSENVTITGTPRILIQGLSSKYFTYSSGSGTTSTAFTYTVASGDTDTDGISINANTLELNSGTIRDAANNNATLTHLAVAASTSQKVDTTFPTFSSAASNLLGTQIVLTYSEALSSTTAATSTFAVTVNSQSATVSSASVLGSTVTLAIGTIIKIGDTATVTYTDPTAGNDGSAVQDTGGNDAGSLSATLVTNSSTVKQNQATLTLSSGSALYGAPYRLVTSGGSGSGAVTYAVSSGPCLISNGDSLTATATGMCSIVATKASDSSFLAVSATAATITIGVGISSSSISISTGNFTFRTEKSISATASVAGRVTFRVNGALVAGCRNLVANQSNSFTVACPYRPTFHGAIVIAVNLAPSNAFSTSSSSRTATFYVERRSGRR